jgi:hypothetical protein
METCRWCGARIPANAVVCPECGVRLRRDSRRCPRCKSEIRVGLAVCPHCAEELDKRRIPWKLIGSLAGLAGVATVALLVVTLVPLPFNLPFVAIGPSPTPTEVLVPPTETPTETPWPPTATPTATATATPVVTATATLTPTVAAGATATPWESPVSSATPTEIGTETPGFRYAAPRLVSPADGEQFNGSRAPIVFRWESVGTLADNAWYSIKLSYEGKDGKIKEDVNWTKDTSRQVGGNIYDSLGADRQVSWNVTVFSDAAGSDAGVAVSPPSETRSFVWQ